MGVLADVLYFINIPRLLTPRRRAPLSNYLFICVLFMTSLLLTLVFYTRMFWIDIVLVSVFVLLFLFMFYSIAKNKVDLEDEYIERKIILDERKKAENNTKLKDLERQLTTASASEKRSIKREMIRLNQKNNATSQDQNRIFDSDLLQDVRNDVREADKNDLRELERLERENRSKLEQLTSEQDVEKDLMKVNEIASLMATQKNIQNLKNKKVGYGNEKYIKISSALRDLKGQLENDENQLETNEKFLMKKRKELSGAVKDSDRKRVERELKQVEAAVKLSREEIELKRKKEKVLREGRIDNIESLDAYNKGAVAVRTEANANDGLVRLMEQNRLKAGQTAADREVAKRSQVLIHDREMQQETLEKALALHENRDMVKPDERDELEKIWKETRKANYGRKEVGNQLILKEDAKLKSDAAQAEEDEVIDSIATSIGVEKDKVKQNFTKGTDDFITTVSGNDKQLKDRLKTEDNLKSLKEKLRMARQKRQKNIENSGELVNIENKIVRSKNLTQDSGSFQATEKTVEEYLNETEEEKKKREKNTENLIDRLSYESGKASDKILDTIQEEDSVLEQLEELKNTFSTDETGKVVSDYEKLTGGLAKLGNDSFNKIAEAISKPGESLESVKQRLREVISGTRTGPVDSELIMKVMKKYSNGDFDNLFGLKEKLNKVISDENLQKFDKVINRKRGKNNFNRAMNRDRNSVIPSNFDQRVYKKFNDTRDTGGNLPDSKDIDEYKDLGYTFKNENGITYFKKPGDEKWNKYQVEGLDEARLNSAKYKANKEIEKYNNIQKLIDEETKKYDEASGKAKEVAQIKITNLKQKSDEFMKTANEATEKYNKLKKEGNVPKTNTQKLKKEAETDKTNAETDKTNAKTVLDGWKRKVKTGEEAQKKLKDIEAKLNKIDENPVVKSEAAKVKKLKEDLARETDQATKNRLQTDLTTTERTLQTVKNDEITKLNREKDVEQNKIKTLNEDRGKLKQAEEAYQQRESIYKIKKLKAESAEKNYQEEAAAAKPEKIENPQIISLEPAKAAKAAKAKKKTAEAKKKTAEAKKTAAEAKKTAAEDAINTVSAIEPDTGINIKNWLKGKGVDISEAQAQELNDKKYYDSIGNGNVDVGWKKTIKEYFGEKKEAAKSEVKEAEAEVKEAEAEVKESEKEVEAAEKAKTKANLDASKAKKVKKIIEEAKTTDSSLNPSVKVKQAAETAQDKSVEEFKVPDTIKKGLINYFKI